MKRILVYGVFLCSSLHGFFFTEKISPFSCGHTFSKSLFSLVQKNNLQSLSKEDFLKKSALETASLNGPVVLFYFLKKEYEQNGCDNYKQAKKRKLLISREELALKKIFDISPQEARSDFFLRYRRWLHKDSYNLFLKNYANATRLCSLIKSLDPSKKGACCEIVSAFLQKPLASKTRCFCGVWDLIQRYESPEKAIKVLEEYFDFEWTPE